MSEPYKKAWTRYLDEGLTPLIGAVKDKDNARFNLLMATTVPSLDREFEITLDKLLSFREVMQKNLIRRHKKVSLTAS
ncbi:methyl-accepting chemotaxis sensory transducer [Lelliottia amnigena]|nr:methyl-accepting chemotaxis sensory transducer [Lelliottia amnigena]